MWKGGNTLLRKERVEFLSDMGGHILEMPISRKRENTLDKHLIRLGCRGSDVQEVREGVVAVVSRIFFAQKQTVFPFHSSAGAFSFRFPVFMWEFESCTLGS